MAILSKKLTRNLGAMADPFEATAQRVYNQLLASLKDNLKTSFKDGKGSLLSQIKENFGSSGVGNASQHMQSLVSEVIDHLFTTGSKDLEFTVNELLEKIGEKETYPMAAKQLLTLAYKAHKRGSKKSARDIFSLAMDAEDSPEMMEDVNEDEDMDVTEDDVMDELEGLVDDEDEDMDDYAESMDDDDDMDDEDEDMDDYTESMDDDEDMDDDMDEDEEDDYSEMSESQLRQLKALANTISANRKPSVSRLGRQLMRNVRAARVGNTRIKKSHRRRR